MKIGDWKGRAVVYRMWDGNGRLLYIGATGNLPHRMSAHRRGSWWFGQVVKTQIKLFPTIEAARCAEAVAIQEENPTFNVLHTGRLSQDYSTWTDDDLIVGRRWHSDRRIRCAIPRPSRTRVPA